MGFFAIAAFIMHFFGELFHFLSILRLESAHQGVEHFTFLGSHGFYSYFGFVVADSATRATATLIDQRDMIDDDVGLLANTRSCFFIISFIAA